MTLNDFANSPLVSQITFKTNNTTRMTTTKQYDLLNRLTSISSLNSQPATINSFTYSYNIANQRTQRAEADASYWVYQYDSLGQVTSGKKYWSDGTPVPCQQFEYGFDDIGNRTSAKAGGNAAGSALRSASYSANTLNQYTSRDVPNAFDVLGASHATNNVTVNGSAADYRRGEYFQELVSVVNSATSVWQRVAVTNSGAGWTTGNVFVAKTPEQFTYDLDGNLTQDGRWTYTWDAENRLTQAESLSSTPAASRRKVVWEYDAKGRRIRQTTSDKSSGSYVVTEDLKLLYDGWACVAELNYADNALRRSYVWGTDLSGSMTGAGGVGGLLMINSVANGAHFYAMDGNGNVTALVKASDGTVSANYEYDPFGQTVRSTGAMANENRFGFSTKRTDRTTDLVLYEYRVYKPSTGSWPNSDPIGEPGFELLRRRLPSPLAGGPNRYLFVNNDPLDKTDALGLQIWTGTTIDQLINTCLAGPNPAACLAELLADADLTAAQRAVIKALMEKAKRIGACYAIYDEYKAAEKEGGGCVAGLTCAEYKKKVAAITLEVTGRAAWLGRKCDDVCPGSVNSKAGSKKKAKDHATELAEKSVYLGKCAALMKAACGEQ